MTPFIKVNKEIHYFSVFYGCFQMEEKIFWKNPPWLISDLIFDQYIQME